MKISLLSKTIVISGIVLLFTLVWAQVFPPREDIYHDGWIDLNKNGFMDPYENPDLPVEERIDDLINSMTLEEKTCQMATLYGYGRVVGDELPTEEWLDKIWKDGIANIDEHLNGLDRPSTRTEYSFPPSRHARALNEVQRFFIEQTRLGIPADFTNEGIRGVCHQGATSFPAQIGVGSTWDSELVSEIGHITGREARILGYTNIYSPILDLARDPRWGRVVECYSEDPYLTARLGVAQVIALQAENVVSTPKHFAIYSIPKGGRDGWARTDPHATRREVEMIYLEPFRAAFQEGRALGTMSSYNDYDGIPITGSKEFLIKILREQWGFKGYVVSDSRAVDFLYSKHHVASDYKDAVRQAVEAGLNVRTNFTFPDTFIIPLRELIREGKLSEEIINERVRDVLRVKFLLGLFDHPYVKNPELADKIVACEKHQKVALEASRKSIVLLKNENSLLPLNKNLKAILVTGPNANSIQFGLSRYGPAKVKVTTILDGIKNKVSRKTKVYFTQGCQLMDENWLEGEILPHSPSRKEKAEIKKAVALAEKAAVAIIVVGEDNRIVGESKSRTSLDLPGHQLDLIKAIFETGTPVVVVLINGRPLTINWIDRYIPAIIEAWFPGAKGGEAVADVLFGDYNPGGKLPVSFPKTVGQIPLNFPYKPGSHADSKHNTRIIGFLYPFGHGLSYTCFEYKNLKITPEKQHPSGNITVSLVVRNTGKFTGDEVVQLYVNDETSCVTTYVKNLRGFKRVSLKPGEEQEIRFTLTPYDLSLINRYNKRVVEPGIFKVMAGSSSEDIRLEGEFEIIE